MMMETKDYKWHWLLLIAGGYMALVLAATFVPGVLNQPIAEGPATWGLLVSGVYIALVIVLLGLAIRPFGRSDKEPDR